jgi:mono/diheme cytochrome c family protein
MRRFATILAAGVLAISLPACGDDEEDGGGGGGETTTEETTTSESGGETASAGKSIFAETCGGCHTLADAGTNGNVGPNLDDIAPDAERVQNAIRQGPGAMPENLLRGERAQQVADYVAGAAGR